MLFLSGRLRCINFIGSFVINPINLIGRHNHFECSSPAYPLSSMLTYRVSFITHLLREPLFSSMLPVKILWFSKMQPRLESQPQKMISRHTSSLMIKLQKEATSVLTMFRFISILENLTQLLTSSYSLKTSSTMSVPKSTS